MSTCEECWTTKCTWWQVECTMDAVGLWETWWTCWDAIEWEKPLGLGGKLGKVVGLMGDWEWDCWPISQLGTLGSWIPSGCKYWRYLHAWVWESNDSRCLIGKWRSGFIWGLEMKDLVWLIRRAGVWIWKIGWGVGVGEIFEKFGVGKGSRNATWGRYLRVGDWTSAVVY